MYVFRDSDIFDSKNILVKDGSFKAGMLDGLNIEFYVGPKRGMGALMQFTTGSAAHNVEIRRKAIRLGYKVNQYGVWDRATNEFIGGETESEFYDILGIILYMRWNMQIHLIFKEFRSIIMMPCGFCFVA